MIRGGIGNQFLIAGQGGKRRELGSTILKTHPWMRLGPVVRQVDDFGIVVHIYIIEQMFLNVKWIQRRREEGRKKTGHDARPLQVRNVRRTKCVMRIGLIYFSTILISFAFLRTDSIPFKHASALL